MTAALESLLFDAVSSAIQRNASLSEAAQVFIPRNARFRNILAVALRLAALPSRELDGLELAAKAAWRAAEDQERELKRIHGEIPPHPAEALPRPTWAKAGTA